MLNTKNILTRGNSYKYFNFLDNHSPFFNLIYGDFQDKNNSHKLNSIYEKNSVIIYIDDAHHSCCKSFKTDHLCNDNVNLIISENWYCDENHEKLKRWPIGISTKYFTKKYINKGLYLIDNMLNKYHHQTKNKLVCNTVKMKGGYKNPASGGINDRGKLKNLVKTKEYNKLGDSFFLSYNEYLNKITNYYYALSPEGNGYDTHRFYELYGMGVIPITRKSVLTPLYKNFPGVHIVDKWHDVLNLDIPKVNFKPDLDLLTVSYWLFQSFISICKIVFLVSKQDLPKIQNNLKSIEELSLIDNTSFICQDIESYNYIQSTNSKIKIELFKENQAIDKTILKYLNQGCFTCFININLKIINNPFKFLFRYGPNHIILEKNQVLENMYNNKFMFILPTKMNIDYYDNLVNDKKINKLPDISYIPDISKDFIEI